MDKILRIDMGAEGGPKATEGPVGDYAGLGGRALTSTLVANEVPPLCHALGGENKLVIAPGLLSGTAAAIVRPPFGGLQEPPDRHHQGVQLRRSGGTSPGSPGLCRHCPGRQADHG